MEVEEKNKHIHKSTVYLMIKYFHTGQNKTTHLLIHIWPFSPACGHAL